MQDMWRMNVCTAFINVNPANLLMNIIMQTIKKFSILVLQLIENSKLILTFDKSECYIY